MNASEWIHIADGLPADGQTVIAKTPHGAREHVVTFRAKPVARWEGVSTVNQLQHFEYWRPVPKS